MSHTWMSHVARVNESRRTFERVSLHTWMSHVAHVNEARDAVRMQYTGNVIVCVMQYAVT